MSRASAQPAARSAGVQLLELLERGAGALRRRGAGGKVAAAAAVVVPAEIAGRLLYRLCGSALWLPGIWREVILLLGPLLGLAAFFWARSRAAAADPQRRPIALRAAPWYAAALAVLAGHVLLRSACVVPWSPPRAIVCALWGEPTAPCEEFDAGQLPHYVALEQHGGAWRGNVLVPLRFSAATAGLMELYREHGREPLRYLLDADPGRLFDRLESQEWLGLGLTTLLFLGTHVAILVLAAAGLGFAWPRDPDSAGAFARSLAPPSTGGAP